MHQEDPLSIYIKILGIFSFVFPESFFLYKGPVNQLDEQVFIKSCKILYPISLEKQTNKTFEEKYRENITKIKKYKSENSLQSTPTHYSSVLYSSVLTVRIILKSTIF